MSVGSHRERRAGMAEQAGDGSHIGTISNHCGCSKMAAVMEPERYWQAGSGKRGLELAVERTRFQWPAMGIREDKSMIIVCWPES